MDIRDILIELPYLDVNVWDFEQLKKKEFTQYTAANGYVSPLHVCYDILDEPVVQALLRELSDFDIRLGHTDHGEGQGLNGVSLQYSTMTEQGLPKHVDAARPACLTIPLSRPQSITFHTDPEMTYNYKLPVIINTQIPHSVKASPHPRWQLQIDIWNTWEEIKQLT